MIIENDSKTENETRYNRYVLLMEKRLGMELDTCFVISREKGKDWKEIWLLHDLCKTYYYAIEMRNKKIHGNRVQVYLIQ